MTERELSTLLYDLGVPPHLYRLDGTHSELAHVLAERDDRWVVFLSERGGESSPVEFDDEYDACLFLFGCVCAALANQQRLRVV